MKKNILVLIILLFCILLIGCSSSKNQITPEIVKAIKTITDGNEYVSINKIENESDHFSIMVEFLFEPESYSQVKSFTDAICEDCYHYFKDHNINQTINVWGYRLKDNDLKIMYGRTRYSEYSGKFEFKTAKELNL